MCAEVKLNKLGHESILSVCTKLKSTLIDYGARSISAPQLGFRYRIFAMDPVFYEDFSEEKSDFEHLFLSEPQSNEELEVQTDELNAYLNQMEFHLNHHVPYQEDLQSIEAHLSQQRPYSMTDIKPMIFINPSWIPLDLEQSIFEMEQQKGNLSGTEGGGDAASNALYTTLLFGCDGVRTSCNYEQCVSFPELMVKKERYNRIRTEFWDENGRKRICYLKSQDARMFQHECDHLDGILMTDHVSWQEEGSILYVDEYERRQQILKPQIEELIAKFSPSQQNELYKLYDPLHPPCDEELIEILELVLQKKDEREQNLIADATDPRNVEM